MYASPTFEFGSPRELLTTLREIQRSSTRPIKPRLPEDLNEVIARYEHSQWRDRNQERKDRRILPWLLNEGTPPLLERDCAQRLLSEVRQSGRGSQICGLVNSFLHLRSTTSAAHVRSLFQTIEESVRGFQGRSRRVLAWKPYLKLLMEPNNAKIARECLAPSEIVSWFDDKPFNPHDRIGLGLTEALAKIVGGDQYGRTADFLHFLNQDPVPPLTELSKIMNALLKEVAERHPNEPDEQLISYCLRQFGDPHLDNKRRWTGFCQEARLLLSAWIADEDLRLFFDELTGDKAGQERLRFWRAYLDAGHVSYSKIFLSVNDRTGASSKLREHLAKGRHGVLSDRSTSAFLVKIGNYFFVEFSKINNALYVYKPGVFGTKFLTQKDFDLRTLKDTNKALQYIAHNGSWQDKVDRRITELTGLRINRRVLERSPKLYRRNVATRPLMSEPLSRAKPAKTERDEGLAGYQRGGLLNRPNTKKPSEDRTSVKDADDGFRRGGLINRPRHLDLAELKKQAALLVHDVCSALSLPKQKLIAKSFLLMAFTEQLEVSVPLELERALLREKTRELPVLLRHYLACKLGEAIVRQRPEAVQFLMEETKTYLGLGADERESLLASATKSKVFHQFLGFPTEARVDLVQEMCNEQFLQKIRYPYRQSEPQVPPKIQRLVEKFRINRDLNIMVAFKQCKSKSPKFGLKIQKNIRNLGSLGDGKNPSSDLTALQKECSAIVDVVCRKLSRTDQKRIRRSLCFYAFEQTEVMAERQDLVNPPAVLRRVKERSALMRHYIAHAFTRAVLECCPNMLENMVRQMRDPLSLSLQDSLSLTASAEDSTEPHRLLGFAPKANPQVVRYYCTQEYLLKMQTPYINPAPDVPKSISVPVERFRVQREQEIVKAHVEVFSDC